MTYIQCARFPRLPRFPSAIADINGVAHDTITLCIVARLGQRDYMRRTYRGKSLMIVSQQCSLEMLERFNNVHLRINMQYINSTQCMILTFL